jgi:hypothetical protein
MVFEYAGVPITADTTQQQFGEARRAAWESQGVFTVGVYNFQFKTYRCVDFVMPPGKPNATLGMVASKIPFKQPEVRSYVSLTVRMHACTPLA